MVGKREKKRVEKGCQIYKAKCGIHRLNRGGAYLSRRGGRKGNRSENSTSLWGRWQGKCNVVGRRAHQRPKYVKGGGASHLWEYFSTTKRIPKGGGPRIFKSLQKAGETRTRMVRAEYRTLPSLKRKRNIATGRWGKKRGSSPI